MKSNNVPNRGLQIETEFFRQTSFLYISAMPPMYVMHTVILHFSTLGLRLNAQFQYFVCVKPTGKTCFEIRSFC